MVANLTIDMQSLLVIASRSGVVALNPANVTKVQEQYTFSSPSANLTLEAQGMLKMGTGLDIVAPKYVLVNIEAELFNDRSVSGGVNVKF